MNEMIPVIPDRDGRPKVAGIDLHRALQCNTPYRKWFPRMCEYGFTEGIDYTTADKIVRRVDGPVMPQMQHVHLLSLGMAKEICLLQRTEIGKKCRQYVLGIEEAWNDYLAVHARAAELDRVRHRQIDEQNKLLLRELSRQENRIGVMQPKAEYFLRRSFLPGRYSHYPDRKGFRLVGHAHEQVSPCPEHPVQAQRYLDAVCPVRAEGLHANENGAVSRRLWE